MADKEIGIVVKAKDEASKQMGDIANNFKSSFQTMSAASAIAGGAIVTFLGSTLSGAAEAEAANRQLEHAVLNVSHANQDQLESTMALADALEAKGVLDGDAIKVGLAQLSTFGLSNDAVQALGGSMADLAVNQFGVNASSDQLSQTANVLAKALNGQFGVLEKSGIRFTEAQQHAIQFGTELEKVAAINEGLAQNLKYTNEVALTTFEGKMAHMNVAIGNVTESIGMALFPVIQQLAEMILPVVQSMMSWINENQQLFAIIVQIVGVVGVMMTLFGGIGLILPALSAGLSAFGAVLAFIVSPVGLVVVGVTALIATLVYLYNTNETVRSAFNAAWSGIVMIVTAAITQVQAIITTTINTIRALWESDWGNIRTIFEEVWAFLTGPGLELVRSLYTLIQNATAPFVAFIKEHWDQIQAAFTTVLDIMKVGWQVFWEEVKLIFGIVWAVVSGLIKAGLAAVKGDWSGAWDAIKGIFVNVWNAISTFLGNVLNIIGAAISTAWNAMGDVFNMLGKTIGDIWNAMWDALKKKVDDIVNSIMGIINNMIGLITSAISKVGDLANSVGGVIGGAFGGGRASGGPVSSGSTYVVGEVGPELFVPNQSGTIIPASRTGGGGGTVNVYVTGNTVLSDDGAEQIGNMFFNKFKLQTRV